MNVYYNDNDPYCCAWLRNLIAAGHLPAGDVDERSIKDVQTDDLRGYTQAHFFAGIGGWPLALRLAGWPDDRPVWTGSCPCQPFSAAGKGKAGDDERHLWPVWFELIRACRPATIFGEQVEAAIGWGWLDLVHTDLEPEGYTVGVAVLPACSVGAPHIRQRLWFVAESECAERGAVDSAHRGSGDNTLPQGQEGSGWLGGCQQVGELADCLGARLEIEREQSARHQRPAAERSGAVEFMADAERDPGHAGRPAIEPREGARASQAGASTEPGRCSLPSPWSDLIWLPCTDGKQRPTQPGIFPLAHGVSARVGKLRAAGNAIVPQVAAEFIKAAM